MKAARIHRFGPPDAIVIDDLPVPVPAVDQVLVRMKGAGVGPWDALIREHKSVVDSPLPLTLGSDLSGIVEAVGSPSCGFQPGDEMYGVTNTQFIGAYAELALADANRIAPKPPTLDFLEAASAPVVAVTAWQMLFDYANASAGQSVLIHGAAGNVGAYAVQLASQAGLHVFATADADDAPYVRELGATNVIDHRDTRFEDTVPPVRHRSRHRRRRYAATLVSNDQARRDSCLYRVGAYRCSEKHPLRLLLSRRNHHAARPHLGTIQPASTGPARRHGAAAREGPRGP